MDRVYKSQTQGNIFESSEAFAGGGLVFTNSKGQVIFSNQAFGDLMGFERRNVMMGKSLHQVLGVGSSDLADLLETGRDRGDATRSVKLEVLDRRGETHTLWLESMPAYDSCNRFLGLNIIVKSLIEQAPIEHLPANPMPAPADAERYVHQVKFVEPSKGERLRQFFTDQVDGLQILMARVAGLRVREAMEMIFNETAQKNLWPAAMVDGNVYIDPVAEEPRIYHTLLGELANYAAIVIGWNTVSAEMRKLETKVEPSILALANETGLRSAYIRAD